MAGEALAGIGEGVNQSMGNLLQFAKMTRDENVRQQALQSPEAQYGRAMNAQALQQFQQEQKRRNTPVSIADAEKNPVYKKVLEYERNNGNPMVANKTHLTAGAIEDYQKDPNNYPVMLSAIQSSMKELGSSMPYLQADAGDKAKKLQDMLPEGQTIQSLQSAIATDPNYLKSNEKLAKAYQEYSASQQSIAQKQQQMTTWGLQQDRLQNEIGAHYGKMTDNELYDRATRGDPRAQNILDAKQASKEEAKADHYTIKNKSTGEIKSIRIKPGESIPKGWDITSPASMEGMNLSGEALDALSKRFSATGEIPGMGMGKAATQARTQVLNKWASDLSKSGQTAEDQLANQAAYKASTNELKRLQGQRGTVMAFAATADKNIQLASKLSDKVGRTGVPVVNRWLLAGKRSVAGDPDTAAFDAAMRTAINEYAKVTSSATGGGVTSDSARKEVESMLNVAQSPEQVKAVIKVLEQEIGNRRSGYDEQISFIKDSISKRATPEKPETIESGVIKGAHGDY